MRNNREIFKMKIIISIIFFLFPVMTICQTNYQTIITYADRDSISGGTSKSILFNNKKNKADSELQNYINHKRVDKTKFEKRQYADSMIFYSSNSFFVITLDSDGDTISNNKTWFILDNILNIIKMEKLKLLADIMTY